VRIARRALLQTLPKSIELDDLRVGRACSA
jgi:hypothetical protein